MDDPEGNLVIVEKCACREAIRLPEAKGRTPQGPQGVAVGHESQQCFADWEYGWDGTAHRFVAALHTHALTADR